MALRILIYEYTNTHRRWPYQSDSILLSGSEIEF